GQRRARQDRKPAARGQVHGVHDLRVALEHELLNGLPQADAFRPAGRPGLPPWRASTAASRAAKLSRSRCYWPVDGHVREVDHGMPPVVAMANRLPVQRSNGGWQLSPGGLVTALRPVMTSRSGAWVGWDGGTKGIPRSLPDFSAQLRPVNLSVS